MEIISSYGELLDAFDQVKTSVHWDGNITQGDSNLSQSISILLTYIDRHISINTMRSSCFWFHGYFWWRWVDLITESKCEVSQRITYADNMTIWEENKIHEIIDSWTLLESEFCYLGNVSFIRKDVIAPRISYFDDEGILCGRGKF